MAMFQAIQKYFAIIGIKKCHPLSIMKNPFNRQNLTIICIFATGSISSILYLFEEPTFEELIVFVYETTSQILCTACTVDIVWKSSKIFDLIKDVEILVQLSE